MSVAYSVPSPRLSLSRAAKAQRRAALETAIEAALQALDSLDGDPDYEDTREDYELACEDEGAQCDDEGMSGIFDPDREPDSDAEPDQDAECNWQEEGDQTALRRLPVFMQRPANIRPSWANVSGFYPVRILSGSR